MRILQCQFYLIIIFFLLRLQTLLFYIIIYFVFAFYFLIFYLVIHISFLFYLSTIFCNEVILSNSLVYSLKYQASQNLILCFKRSTFLDL